MGRIVPTTECARAPGFLSTCPADPTLHRLAEEIEVECKHSLKNVRDSIFDEEGTSDRPRPVRRSEHGPP